MTADEEVRGAFRRAFLVGNGQYGPDGTAMMAHLTAFCGGGIGHPPKDKQGRIDETALLIAVGRRQVLDHIYTLINSRSSS